RRHTRWPRDWSSDVCSSDLVSPHLSRMRPLVLPGESVVEVQITTDLAAIVSVDGQFDTPITSGCIVRVRQSPHRARFIRLGPPKIGRASCREREYSAGVAGA